MQGWTLFDFDVHIAAFAAIVLQELNIAQLLWRQNLNCIHIRRKYEPGFICFLHVVSSDDVKTKYHLLHACRVAVNSLVTLIQDQINCLIKTF